MVTASLLVTTPHLVWGGLIALTSSPTEGSLTIRAPPFHHSGGGSRWTCDHLLIRSLGSKSRYFSIFCIELYLTPVSTGLQLMNDLVGGGSKVPQF